MLKTTEQGYDGKGQIRVATDDDASSCWNDLNTNEAILESFIDFTAEVSFLVWRDANGQAGVFQLHGTHIKMAFLQPASALLPALRKPL